MRKKVIAGNWKMNKTQAEVEAFIEGVKSIEVAENNEAIICAPYVYLPTLVAGLKDSSVKVSAQNVHFEENGAFTGEVSPLMLKDIGVTHTVIGHSERREYYNETDQSVNQKVHAAFKYGLTPIVCVGETLAQREANETLSHIESQVTKALEGLSNDQVKSTILAYEPIWAIGTGKTASSEQANEVCGHVRQVVAKLTDQNVADAVSIQYGGSVKPANIDELLETSDIDGALVGGASLEVDSFKALVESGNQKA